MESTSISKKDSFQRHIPDTTNNYYAQLFDYPNYLRKNLITKKLGLIDIEKGVTSLELRVWTVSGSFNPQTLYVLKDSSSSWIINKYEYYVEPAEWNTSSPDSIKFAHFNAPLGGWNTFVDSLLIEEIWQFPSQSEMIKGKKFGCMDGYGLIIELANKQRYKYLFYQCPDIHAEKDSVFRKVVSLCEQFGKIKLYK